MTGFPLPPITQWRVRNLDTGESRIANGWKGNTIEEVIEEMGGSAIHFFAVDGRRRLNDYVGSPIWSEWEEIG